jgi:hypothetical protein
MSFPFNKQAVIDTVLSYTRPADLTYPDPNETATKYTLTTRDFMFDPREEYPSDRFANALRDGILYRPEIVKAMKEVVFSPANERFGVLVRGPHGVGKSHSLVNLVHTLRSDGHIVTFVPDCERWDTARYLLQAICRSLGTTMEKLGFTVVLPEPDVAKIFVEIMVEALKRLNENKHTEVRWILVVDQLNKIFGRPGYEGCKDIGVLPLPFKLMKTLNTSKYVQVVVSASANNSTSYRDNQRGFRTYDHPLFMSADEINVWKPAYEGRDEEWWRGCLDATGRCPLQVAEFLNWPSRKEYESDAAGRVYVQTINLLEESSEHVRSDIKNHAVYCLLSVSVTSYGSIFDKKYSVLAGDLIKPTFPAVLIAYRNLFWDDLMEYVEKHEYELLATCANPNVTNDVRGRLFELIVISRFRKESVAYRHWLSDHLSVHRRTSLATSALQGDK